jgi:hypothetical protein
MRPEGRRAAAERLHGNFSVEKGELWLRFEGRSMAPMLRDGDLLRVRLGAPRDLACGTIVAFRDHDVTIVHRFLYRRRRDAALITKGDNAWRTDRPLPADQLLGTVCTIRRGADRIALDGRGWRRLSRGIALASMLEGFAFAGASALRRRLLPRALVGRLGEGRVLEAVGACRRSVIARLLRVVGAGDARKELCP